MHHPDFSSSDDEFNDDFEFQEYVKEQRKNRNSFTFQLTEEQKKEQQLKNFYLYLSNGKLDEVLSELNNGLDVNQQLQNGWTPILVASSTGNYELAKELHKRGADIHTTKDGQTALMLACNCPDNTTSFKESSRLVELLLELGVNPNALNRKRMNALMFAANNGNLEAIELLLPVTDLKVEDNQNWNALFWAVNSGKVEVVEYLIDKGIPFDRVDIRGNTPLQIATENDFHKIVDLFSPEEADDTFVIEHYNTDFESIFKYLENDEKPQFFLDICKILHGTRCESLIKLFSEKETNLLDLLSCTENDLKQLGVVMPFQRKRLIQGIYQFHKYAYHPKSLPTVGKNELYSNMDAAAAVLSAVKQIITMEASLKYVTKSLNDYTEVSDDKEIKHAIHNIEQKTKGLKLIARKLSQKAEEWDSQIEPVNIITNKSGRRWFPWRKISFGIGVLIGIQLWKRSLRTF